MFKNTLDLEKKAKKVREELNFFFQPESIAIIGASREKGTIGWNIFYNLLEVKKERSLNTNIYGVNINGGRVLGKKLYKSILNIEGDVEHAIFSIPAKHVPQAMKEAGKKGIKVATIVSAGFSEVGNIELEKEVGKIAKEYGIRVIGPNGLGVYDPYSGMDTMFLPKYKKDEEKEYLSAPRPGKGLITFFSQSGALGLATLDYMEGQGMGISKFISAGNMLDVEEEQILLYALKDPTTRVISFYIEGLEGGRDFIRLGKEVVKKKPIVVLKGGQTKAGARATKSHTASLAGNYRIYHAAFEQMGAIVTKDLIEFVDTQKALALQPPARGNKVGIVTNGGGAGVITTDEAERVGLEVPSFQESTMKKFNQLIEKGVLPEFSTFANPCDITGSGDTKSYIEATKTVLEDESFDMVEVIALHHPPAVKMNLAERLYTLVQDYRKPVVMTNFGSAEAGQVMRQKFNDNGIPAYPTPERGMRALSALYEYGQHLKDEDELNKYLRKYKEPKV